MPEPFKRTIEGKRKGLVLWWGPAVDRRGTWALREVEKIIEVGLVCVGKKKGGENGGGCVSLVVVVVALRSLWVFHRLQVHPKVTEKDESGLWRGEI